jgi:phosphate transport system permease protein
VSSHALTLKSRKLPAWAPWAVAVVAIVLAYLGVYAGGLLGGGTPLTALAAAVLYLIGVAGVATAVEGSRAARNRVASSTGAGDGSTPTSSPTR